MEKTIYDITPMPRIAAEFSQKIFKKISKIMLNFQRTYKYQVVRIWNDNLVIASLLDNRAIIKDLIDSNTDSVTED